MKSYQLLLEQKRCASAEYRLQRLIELEQIPVDFTHSLHA